MPRALTASAKKKRLEKKQRKIEKPSDLPDSLSQATVEFLYRTGKEVKQIVEFTGIPQTTVYRHVKKIKETGTAAPAPKSGRPATATSARNITKARKLISRDPEKSQAEIAKKLGISKASMSRLVRRKLQSRSYRMGRGPLLTDAHKQSRLEMSQRMLDFINATHPISTLSTSAFGDSWSNDWASDDTEV
jgi:transposase